MSCPFFTGAKRSSGAGIPMALFAVEARVDSFLKVADWLVDELKAG